MAQIDTIALDDRLSYVLPYVNGAPASTVRFHLRQAAVQFCRRTLIWQATLDPVLTVVNQDTYPIPLPDDSRLVNIMRFRVAEQCDSELLTPAQGRWQRAHQHYSNADGVYTEDRLNFTVVPMPKIAGQAMVMDVALCPTEDALEIPQFIADQYIQDIALGAIGTIAAIPRQSFSDPNQAASYTTQFNNAISRVARIVSKGSAQSKQRVRGHFF
jgi:hypothetical protein